MCDQILPQVSISFQFALLSLTSKGDDLQAFTTDPVLARVRAAKDEMPTFSETFCVIFSRGSTCES